MSWHHYPEVHLVAIDIFMCGTANPENALPRIREFWQPRTVDFKSMRRGIVQRHKLTPALRELVNT